MRETDRVEELRLHLSDEKFIHQAIIGSANFGAPGRGQVDILLVPSTTVKGGDQPTDAPPARLHLL
jgi:hypothetical protein